MSIAPFPEFFFAFGCQNAEFSYILGRIFTVELPMLTSCKSKTNYLYGKPKNWAALISLLHAVVLAVTD